VAFTGWNVGAVGSTGAEVLENPWCLEDAQPAEGLAAHEKMDENMMMVGERLAEYRRLLLVDSDGRSLADLRLLTSLQAVSPSRVQ
jgi:hypothetical protein